ncbi:hypothetical protein LCGC14_1654070 [marine sediment metagenome]|uniref:Uncharacterized protein n=1 Tax=marine sediment metagenome TaxID=412755 RepID=A0A0F9HVX8_9ZZZZ
MKSIDPPEYMRLKNNYNWIDNNNQLVIKPIQHSSKLLCLLLKWS